MKFKKLGMKILCGLLISCLPLFAQRKESSGLLLDVNLGVLTPLKEPMSLGGGPAIGWSFRDFNLFFRPSAYLSDITGNQRPIIIPSLRAEAKLPFFGNLLTLLPYADIGSIIMKFRRVDGSFSSFNVAPYFELGVGGEFALTHEISAIARTGFAYALIYDGAESSNHSGVVISLGARYTWGKNPQLDY